MAISSGATLSPRPAAAEPGQQAHDDDPGLAVGGVGQPEEQVDVEVGEVQSGKHDRGPFVGTGDWRAHGYTSGAAWHAPALPSSTWRLASLFDQLVQRDAGVAIDFGVAYDKTRGGDHLVDLPAQRGHQRVLALEALREPADDVSAVGEHQHRAGLRDIAQPGEHGAQLGDVVGGLADVAGDSLGAVAVDLGDLGLLQIEGQLAQRGLGRLALHQHSRIAGRPGVAFAAAVGVEGDIGRGVGHGWILLGCGYGLALGGVRLRPGARAAWAGTSRPPACAAHRRDSRSPLAEGRGGCWR